MTLRRDNRGFAANVLFALLLVVAQAFAVAHAYEHEAGAAQNQACTACVTASQLASACVDSHVFAELFSFGSPLNDQTFCQSNSFDAIVVRQRGPPTTLNK